MIKKGLKAYYLENQHAKTSVEHLSYIQIHLESGNLPMDAACVNRLGMCSCYV